MEFTINKAIYGVLVGLIAPFIAILCYSSIYFPNQELQAFLQVFNSNHETQVSLISLSLIIDVLLFFISLQLFKWERFSFGIVTAILIFIPWIAYLRFTTA